MRINNNIMALNTHRQYNIANAGSAASAEKLSSGYRINRAGDDAAGLAISEKMRAQIRGLNMASKNSQDAVSLVQTAEGALQESHNILQRMRELSVQASSDTNDTGVDRAALDEEFQALKAEIDNIAEITHFNGKKLLDGSFGVSIDFATSADFYTEVTPATDPKTYDLNAAFESIDVSGESGAVFTFSVDTGKLSVTKTVGDVTTTIGGIDVADGKQTINVAEFGLTIKTSDTFAAASSLGTTGSELTLNMGASDAGAKIQTGANEGESLGIAIDKMDTSALEIKTSSVATRDDASKAITEVNSAINKVSTQRSKLGAIQNRLNHKIANLDTSAENLSAAESRIRDIDMAKEMTNFTKQNILSQAATAMLAQANSAPQNVLQLLR